MQLADFVASVPSDPIVYMLMAFVALTIMRTVIEVTPMIIALAPLMAPVAVKLGIPDIQFGLVFCMTVLVGMIHPAGRSDLVPHLLHRQHIARAPVLGDPALMRS